MINILIGADTTGENTDAENQRFVAAVKAAIEAEYPNDIVVVEMTNDSGTPLNEEFEAIVRRVWESANY